MVIAVCYIPKLQLWIANLHSPIMQYLLYKLLPHFTSAKIGSGSSTVNIVGPLTITNLLTIFSFCQLIDYMTQNLALVRIKGWHYYWVTNFSIIMIHFSEIKVGCVVSISNIWDLVWNLSLKTLKLSFTRYTGNCDPGGVGMGELL